MSNSDTSYTLLSYLLSTIGHNFSSCHGRYGFNNFFHTYQLQSEDSNIIWDVAIFFLLK
nr:MAG TPA: hypothetical protein [Caudoviricetes sp.]